MLDRGKEFKLRGFYVSPKHQGKGMGKRLWALALDFAKRKDVVLDIYAHNRRTIGTYKIWRFVIDIKKVYSTGTGQSGRKG